MHHAFFLGICAIWGSNFILMSRAARALGPIEMGFWRLVGGGLLAAVAWGFTRRESIPRDKWPHILLVGLVANAVPFALQPVLISQGFGHSFFGFMVAFVPLLTMAVSIPMLGVWPTNRQLLGVSGGLIAVGLLVWEGQSRGMSSGLLLGALLVPLVYALGNTYIRWKLRGLPTTALTSAILLSGAAWLVPLLMAPELLQMLGIGRPSEPVGWPTAWACVLWLGLVGTGLAGLLFVRLIQLRGPLFAGMVAYIVPLIALAWGSFDREPITTRQLTIVVLVLAMVALVQFSPTKE